MNIRLRPLPVLFALLVSFSASAQEVCNNAIDDDFDGLTDLNDTTDCVCNAVIGGAVSSIIPNASFEDTNCIPQSFSEMNCATGWGQATGATSDYFNTAGFFPTPPIPTPLPGGGNGVVGGFIARDFLGVGQDYQEYVGACLSSAMVAGTEYTLQIYVAGVLTNTSINDSYPIDFGPLDITVFGNPNCQPQMSGTYECPPETDPTWVELGATSYQADGEWGLVTINFTPTQDINAVIIGGPCVLPLDFVGDFSQLPYFFYDELTLNESALFGAPIDEEGELYGGDETLTATPDSQATGFQWYQEGVALVGQTDTVLDVSALGLWSGCYQFLSSLDTACAISEFCIQEPICIPGVLDAFTQAGCAPFTVNFDNGTDTSQVQSLVWDFGDNSPTSNAVNPSHVYAEPGIYSVSLSVISDDLCPMDTTFDQLIEVYQLPEASFTSNLVEGCLGVQIQFTNTTDTLTGGCAWDFGDITPTNFNCDPLHTFNTAGLFDVELTVTSANGCADDTTMTEYVLVYEFPTVRLVPDTVEGCTPLTITFENNTPTYMVGTAQWDLGNDSTSTDTAGTSTTYTMAGSYDVFLSITAPGGCQADTTYEDLITVHDHPVVFMTAVPDSGCYPLEVTFTNNTDPAYTGSCIWDFGDGNQGETTCSPVFTYQDPGEFTARLHVISPYNCAGDTAEALITVYDHPTAAFVFGPQPTDFFDTYISFTDSSSIDAIEWAWTFGQDGALGFSDLEHPALHFPSEDFGTYPVQLIVTNANTCTDTAYADVVIDGYYSVYAPNAFTPDGDGVNEFFMPVITDQNEKFYRLSVYNRWGGKVFDSSNPRNVWIGTDMNTAGDPLPMGVYVWHLQTASALDALNKEYFGHVTLLR